MNYVSHWSGSGYSKAFWMRSSYLNTCFWNFRINKHISLSIRTKYGFNPYNLYLNPNLRKAIKLNNFLAIWKTKDRLFFKKLQNVLFFVTKLILSNYLQYQEKICCSGWVWWHMSLGPTEASGSLLDWVQPGLPIEF